MIGYVLRETTIAGLEDNDTAIPIILGFGVVTDAVAFLELNTNEATVVAELTMPFAVADRPLNRNEATLEAADTVELVSPDRDRKSNPAAAEETLAIPEATAFLATYVKDATVDGTLYPGGLTPKIQPELLPPSVLVSPAYHVDAAGVA